MDFCDIQKIAEIDLYEILNVNKDDNIKIIKKKYKKMVLKVHPDKPTGDKDIYELVNLSYSVLKNDKLRNIYDSERSKILQNTASFVDLKKYHNKTKVNSIPTSIDDAKKEYSNLESMYNEKHGFDNENIGPISQSEMMKRLNNLNFNRKDFIKNTKSKIKKVNLSNNDFNDKFLKDGIIDESFSNEIMAYNDSTNSSIIGYSGINNFDLYNGNGADTSNYSSIDSAFTSKLPGNVSNNYNTHNNVTDKDRSTFKDRMKDYNNATNNIKNMKINDYN